MEKMKQKGRSLLGGIAIAMSLLSGCAPPPEANNTGTNGAVYPYDSASAAPAAENNNNTPPATNTDNTASINATATAPAVTAASNVPVEHTQSPGPMIEGQYTSIWDVIRQGFTLNHYYNNKQVQAFVTQFTRDPKFVNNSLQRATPYLYTIVGEIQQNNLPMELALLPIIESGFQAKARSYCGALGIWQLMPAAAKRFNVGHDNFWYKGRENFEASTQAALAYLKYLYNFFNGDWYLALAAYDWGEGSVERAVERNGARALPTDYWSLRMPKQTRDYVPELLALAIIINNPSQYGITLPDIPNRPLTGKVVIPRQMSLAQAAKFAGVTKSEVQNLNPAYIKGVTPPKKAGTYYLTLPIDKIMAFEQNCEASTETGLSAADLNAGSLSQTGTYTVKAGDTLSSVSRFTGVSIKTLRRYNHLKSSHLRANQVLKYPVNVSSAVAYKTYHVKRGDTLSKIARRYHINVFDLMQWNGITNPQMKLKVGARLVVHQKIRYQ